jgi:hypothetical protein
MDNSVLLMATSSAIPNGKISAAFGKNSGPASFGQYVVTLLTNKNFFILRRSLPLRQCVRARTLFAVALNGKETDHVYLTSLVTNTTLNAGAAFNLNAFASNIKVQRSFLSYFGETAESNWSMVGKYFLNRFSF